ncbi:cytochrome P450 [Actinomadura rudentiformis]|uniref:Cytochrome P450 n=1 Tax=Actinomadura rudentiformis TaxID=359158 RepID=A0A6H9YI38_9ACTN|nr:cytochrome P450 [Actinomadura rudentiformis]KAB2339307.1 cytochrome P450 [Actinomadura rudentiformis]
MADVTFSPYDYYDIDSDPYPVYARLREEAPLYRNEELEFWALSRHADVMAALRDPMRFSSANGPLLESSVWGPAAQRALSFIAMDPPRHTRMRAIVSRVFTPRRVAELEPHIRAAAHHHIQNAFSNEQFDFIADVSAKVPTDVISELVGVPPSDRAEVRRLADVALHREVGGREVTQEGLDALLVLVGHFAELVAERRNRRRDDLVSALLDAQVDGDRLTDEEIVAFLHLLVGAGNETTTNLLGNAVYWAWRHPDQKAKALAGHVPEWVEETLRYDTAAPTVLRSLTCEVELHGVAVPQGSRVLLLPGAANRDPVVFADPDCYDLSRDTGSMISFGNGPHFCLGASLARLEARVTLEELSARIADFDLDLSQARRRQSPYIRGFAALPMTTVR